MNRSRVRGGEGRFITFVFFFEDKKGDSIENNKIKGYKSTLLTSSSCHPKIFVKEFSYFLMSCH